MRPSGLRLVMEEVTDYYHYYHIIIIINNGGDVRVEPVIILQLFC